MFLGDNSTSVEARQSQPESVWHISQPPIDLPFPMASGSSLAIRRIIPPSCIPLDLIFLARRSLQLPLCGCVCLVIALLSSLAAKKLRHPTDDRTPLMVLPHDADLVPSISNNLGSIVTI
jgi:hypothetical protein